MKVKSYIVLMRHRKIIHWITDTKAYSKKKTQQNITLALCSGNGRTNTGKSSELPKLCGKQNRHLLFDPTQTWMCESSESGAQHFPYRAHCKLQALSEELQLSIYELYRNEQKIKYRTFHCNRGLCSVFTLIC